MDVRDELQPLAQHVKCTASLQRFVDLLKELSFDRRRILRLQFLPVIRLRFAHETEQQRLIEGKRPVVILGA